jgi:hypothetical protein
MATDDVVQFLERTCKALAADARATHVRSSRLLNILAEALVTAPYEKMLDWRANTTEMSKGKPLERGGQKWDWRPFQRVRVRGLKRNRRSVIPDVKVKVKVKVKRGEGVGGRR